MVDSNLTSTIPMNLRAYLGLRAEILASRLRPGERLKIQQLCSRLKVSPGAVRESLASLCAEGFVVSEPWKGFRVAPISVEDLDDLTRTRLTIDIICLRQSIEGGGIEWEPQLVAAAHRLSRLSQQIGPDGLQASDEWAEAHAHYHLSLVAACGSPSLLHVRQGLFAQSERYRRLSLTPRPGRDLDAEHRAMARAALDRDADRACILMSDHLLMTPFLVRRFAEHFDKLAVNDDASAPSRALRGR